MDLGTPGFLLLLGVSVYALLVLFTYVFGFRMVLSMRPRVQTRIPLPQGEVPDADLRLFAESRAQLERLGFRFSHYESRSSTDIRLKERTTVLIMSHQESGAYAERVAGPEPDFDVVVFVTRFDEGRILVTTDCIEHMVIERPPTLWLHDAWSGSLDAHWQHHCQAVEARSAADATVEPLLPPERYVEDGAQFDAASFQWLRSSGQLRTVKGDDALTVGTAHRFYRGLRAGTARAQKIKHKAGVAEKDSSHQQDVLSEADRLDADVVAYRRLETLFKFAPLQFLPKLILFVVSAIAFAALFGLAFDLSFGVTLLVVIAIHELGHVLGMKFFGYRDLGILFLPMLGALAHGTKEQPRLLEKVVVSLMGPVPGLIIGVVMLELFDASSATQYTYALVFLIINYLNLLPMLPLDGGHVLNNTLFARSRHAEFYFYAASTLALLASALWFREPLLAVLGLFIGWSTWGRLKTERLRRSLNLHAVDGRSEDTVLREILSALPSISLDQSAERYHLVTDLLERQERPSAGLKEIVVALTLYFAALALPFAASDAPGDIVSRLFFDNRVEQDIDYDERIANAGSPQEKLELLVEAGEEGWWATEGDESSSYYGRAVALAEAQGLTNEHYARALFGVGEEQIFYAPTAALDSAQRGVALLEALADGPDQAVGQTYLGMAELYATVDPPQVDAMQEALGKALAIFTALDDANGAMWTQVDLAESFALVSNAPAQEQALRRALEYAIELSDESSEMMEVGRRMDLGHFLVHHDRFGEAQAEFRRGIDDLPKDEYLAFRREPLLQLLGRTFMLAGDAAAAVPHFEQRVSDLKQERDSEWSQYAEEYAVERLIIAHVDLMVAHDEIGNGRAAQRTYEDARTLASSIDYSLEDYAEVCESCAASVNTGLDARFKALSGPALSRALKYDLP